MAPGNLEFKLGTVFQVPTADIIGRLLETSLNVLKDGVGCDLVVWRVSGATSLITRADGT